MPSTATKIPSPRDLPRPSFHGNSPPSTHRPKMTTPKSTIINVIHRPSIGMSTYTQRKPAGNRPGRAGTTDRGETPTSRQNRAPTDKATHLRYNLLTRVREPCKSCRPDCHENRFHPKRHAKTVFRPQCHAHRLCSQSQSHASHAAVHSTRTSNFPKPRISLLTVSENAHK